MAEGLYVDDAGRVIVTQSMIKTFRRCPKQADYKYRQRLKPRIQNIHLRRGIWLHELLEEHHNGGDWRALHARKCVKFNELLDEERDYYGNLPHDLAQVMESYEWHYALDPWKVLETEFTIETELPDGSIFRGKVDALVENQHGMWFVDHKSHRSLPDLSFRIKDAQSGLYLWAGMREKMDVRGFIWNYLRWKPATEPKLVYQNTSSPRISKTGIETDYLTYTRTLRKHQRENSKFRITSDYVAYQRSLKLLQYTYGEPQLSPFFRRQILEKDREMLTQVAREAYHTHTRMRDYPFGTSIVERVPDRSCSFCDFRQLCEIELLGGNTKFLRRQHFTIGDPQDYYQDRAGEVRA